MKRLSLIGSVTVLSAFVLSLTAVHYPSAPGRTASEPRVTSRDEHAQTPVRKTFKFLKIAAQPLAHFSTMKQAIAASNVEAFEPEDVFAESTVRLTGVGPVQIGMTVQEAADAMNLPVVPLARNVTGECSYYQPKTPSQSLGFMVVDDRIIRVDVWSGSSLATVSGVIIGDTEETLFEHYSDQLEVTPNSYTQGKFLTFVPNDPELSLYRLVFETDAEGKVVQYRTGQFPAVTWPDGCV
ncbi:hypothetical protein PN498_22960 [Oscillatoria sp. CS-180]|uniref:hypothetical protein n=1 Tax=Oscillatoria sp. CS-180 TaxID=3021720 RepID=UPI00232FA3DF|nr:hypothetical protein [Oscillatoria sp. CS-180]MDB9528872.1 hypothetical protein [Oscillatoria sp. CS-180]